MARLSMTFLALASAGLVTLGAALMAHPRAEARDDPKPQTPPAVGTIHARVVDAQGWPVPGQVVHVFGALGVTEKSRTFTTDVGGLIRIPGDGVVTLPTLTLVTIPDETSIGWGSVGFSGPPRGRYGGPPADDHLDAPQEPAHRARSSTAPVGRSPESGSSSWGCKIQATAGPPGFGICFQAGRSRL